MTWSCVRYELILCVSVVINYCRDTLPAIVDIIVVSPQIARLANGCVICLELKTNKYISIRYVVFFENIRLPVISKCIFRHKPNLFSGFRQISRPGARVDDWSPSLVQIAAELRIAYVISKEMKNIENYS